MGFGGKEVSHKGHIAAILDIKFLLPSLTFLPTTYRTIPKISPSMHKPPRGLFLEIALKYKVKQSKNGKFPSNYKASPIDFETQISLRR